ncbi:MAG: AmpG family muropeptide MFS transporter [Azoarcus sp.]|nr:AmpG family muropeptide MFS transporter [Azoarcus sp.]
MNTPSRQNWLRIIFNRRMLVCVFTGFTSGLPLYLLFNLLPAWLKTEGLSLKAIGAFALIQFPYTWKFLWSPLLDRYALPWLGHRRGWMAVFQIALLGIIAWLGRLSPRDDLFLIVLLTAMLAFLSASLDIVLDAFRRNLLADEEQEMGNTLHVNAYKIASLVPGSLSLVLSDHLPWAQVFLITALFMLPGLAMTLLTREPRAEIKPPKTLRSSIVEPFLEFFYRHGIQTALFTLAFILLYKLGDSLCTALATPFYLEMGFTRTEIGLIAKNAGLWPSVLGGVVGGVLMTKIGVNRALWVFGVLQGIAILGFTGLAYLGPADATSERLWVLAGVIGFEALGVGLGTAASVSFIARTTHPMYVATQFALLTSLTAVPRTFINASAGWLVEGMGWPSFFWLCFFLAIPGMLLLFKVAPWNGAPPVTDFKKGLDFRRTFNVYSHPARGMDAVKVGFSWPGFFFSILKVVFSGLAGWIAVQLSDFLFFSNLGYFLQIAADIVTVFVVFVAVYIGIVVGVYKNRLRDERFIKQGFVKLLSLKAETAEAAIAAAMDSANLKKSTP